VKRPKAKKPPVDLGMAKIPPKQTDPTADSAPLSHSAEAATAVPASALNGSASVPVIADVPSSPPVPVPIPAAALAPEGLYPPRAMFPFGYSRADLRRAIGLLVTFLAVGWFLFQVHSILTPFLIAFALAALLDPGIRAAERRGRSRVQAILAIYAFALLSMTLVFLLIIPPARSQFDSISSNYNAYYLNAEQKLDAMIQQNRATLNRLNIREERVRDFFTSKPGQESWLRRTTNGLIGGITVFLQDTASKLFWLIIIPIAGFFFMRDYPLIRARIILLFPEAYQEEIDKITVGVVDVFSRYLKGLARICFLYGTVMCGVFWLMGLKYWLFLGMLAGTLYAMPYVGQLITAAVVGGIAYSMDAHKAAFLFSVSPNSTGYAIACVLAVIIMNNVFDQIVYPNIVGESVGLHPVLSIFALASGATLFGIWGMLLAVPVAASIQIIFNFCFPKLSQPIPDHLLHEPAS
jgi:predicted PurR-regulated permease PerM